MASSSSSFKRKRVTEENAFQGMASPLPVIDEPSKRKREMEENAFQEMAHAPPSPPPASDDPSFHCHHVFSNHRGPDVENTVASVLYQFLQYLGLKVFLDSTDLELGESLSANVQRVIGNSSVHIAIFSKGYAYSPSCLAELCLMLETGSKIVPLFYGVVPSDLRYVEKGVYANAFATYSERKSYIDKLEQWKQALHNASFISGIEFDPSNGNLGNLCKDIVDTVFFEVREAKTKLKLEVADHPVGLEEAIQELEAKISSVGQNYNGNVKIVGIVGRAGVGKTTLAKEFYNRKHPMFCKSSFLFDVGEAHRTKKIAKMQDKLKCDLSMPLPLSTAIFRPGSPKEGLGVEMNKSQIGCWYLKPLIILDGIDHADQLEALSVNEYLNHGALVIVTCRDANILQSFEMVNIYEMGELDPWYARQLFCWHAFRQSHPPKGYEKLVEVNIRVSRGLPLHLKILGQGIFSLQNDIDAQV